MSSPSKADGSSLTSRLLRSCVDKRVWRQMLNELRIVDWLKSVLLAVLVLLLGLVVAMFSTVEAVIALSVALLIFVISVVYLQLNRRLNRLIDPTLSATRDYGQIEALFSLFSLLHIRKPLPPMRAWALSPDVANLLVRSLLDRKPSLVLECGSGTSTLIISYCLKQNGSGKVISLENDDAFARATRENIKLHGLDDVAEVVDAPLEDIKIAGSTYRWYSPRHLPKVSKVDILFIDGPRADLRYPALPMLVDLLSDHAVVIIDDASSKRMKSTVDRWEQEYSGIFPYRTFINTEKGSLVLSKTLAAPEALTVCSPDALEQP